MSDVKLRDQSFTADGHPTDASHWPHFNEVAPLLASRREDLGHYLFIRARATSEPREGLLIALQQRIRDVVQGPDGYIYVATEKGLRGNTADGMVLRIEPADQ